MLKHYRQWRGRKRRIFKYDDGTRRRRADPLAIAQLLALHPDYLPRHIDEALSGQPEAQEIVARACCDCFPHITPFDDDTGAGLTATERIMLVDAFDRYLLALKKNTRSPPTSPTASVVTPQTSPGVTTNFTSAYG